MRDRRQVLGLRPWLILALLLSGCGSMQPYARSREPEASGEVVRKAIEQTFKAAKLTGTPMASRVYAANPVSPGDWLICLRGSNAPKRDTYSLYFTGYTFVTAQRSVLVDHCDEQAYAPYAGASNGPPPLGEPMMLAPR